MESVTLSSGTQVEIRPIEVADRAALGAAYDRLSDETKYRRFMAVKPHLSGSDLRYLTEIDGARHVALVATLAGRPDQIIGVARFVRLANEPEVAEFAVVVGDPYQGTGLGSALVERLAAAAVEAGVKRFIGTMLADNIAAHKLTRRLAGKLAHERHFGPVDELEVDLAA